ncbi:TIGR04255 family protein [Burkholderia oklahomensis]|uniref:TIGR04255 family protein n=1 Tax=Burkholderia oklahomensis TaxID=342113 RepID=A0AAI8BF77_9BURK|nr:TIGR04255 family protein [Burkholderia oklahomensis]AIO70884.1 hypothetical protein DM82_6231 [Burkholderia oklahomensis]AOI38480.1 hypothetical protein WG70_01805 [Burkholderia oklahomensis EO147]KUY48399.1 hypothetical protein WG70_01855 [Burkholderia oklahomensis EO147]QPS41173.1 TIGR04255 family protein [Burkholderia oklahomensis]
MYEEVCYRKSFLKQVIAKVDFASPLKQLDDGVPPNLLNAIVHHFAIVEPPADMLSHEVSFDNAGVRTKQITSKQRSFFAIDRSRQLVLAAQAMFINYTSYSTYEETKAQFVAAIDAISASFPEAKVARFGLRYINEITVPLDDPTQWETYIDDRLLGSRSFFGDHDPLTRSVSITELGYDEIGLRFQYGIPNPDYPAVVRRPLFILDFDASVSQAHDLRDVAGYMDAAHGRIQELYERSIKESLREQMDVRRVQQ